MLDAIATAYPEDYRARFERIVFPVLVPRIVETARTKLGVAANELDDEPPQEAMHALAKDALRKACLEAWEGQAARQGQVTNGGHQGERDAEVGSSPIADAFMAAVFETGLFARDGREEQDPSCAGLRWSDEGAALHAELWDLTRQWPG